MKILGIIPARYASTRFPAKPLADLGGRSMIRRVYTQANKCDSLTKVVVVAQQQCKQEIAANPKSVGYQRHDCII